MDSLGNIRIEFSTTMKVEGFNLTDINSTNVDMYLVPNKNWHISSDYKGFN